VNDEGVVNEGYRSRCGYRKAHSSKRSRLPVSYEWYALATLGYFSLGWSKLDPDNNRKTHPRSFLPFSKAVGLG
jgi:hypothetical protein